MKTLQKLPENVGDLGKIIVAKGFKKLHKVQKIAQSGHTGLDGSFLLKLCALNFLNGPTRPLLLFIFGLFKQTTLQYLQQIHV